MEKPSPTRALLVFAQLALLIGGAVSDEILGCGGFLKSHADIDFSKVEVKLLTKQGSLKDTTDCSPSNGYYFLPVYDKGDYVLRIAPPPGWSFEPAEIAIAFDGHSDLCSQGKDVNFSFKGFGITGSVQLATAKGARGVTVELRSESGTDVRTTTTDATGVFYFTPVIPGTYTIAVRRDSWHFVSDVQTVVVRTGNTELPANSFVVGGFAVAGSFNVDGLSPAASVAVALFASKDVVAPLVAACTLPADVPATLSSNNAAYAAKPACLATVDRSGRYVFAGVPTGRYLLKPLVQNANVLLHIAPESIEINVLADRVQVPAAFEVTGFSVSGRVLSTVNGWGVAAAVIKLNGKEVTKTHTDGSYTLTNIKAGTYTIQAIATDVQFNDHTVKVSLGDAKLPDIVVATFKVCGQVVSPQAYTVALTKQASTFHTQTSTQAGTGEWCAFLPVGRFTVEVLTTEADRNAGVQFFPLQQNVDVKDSPVSGIMFSQLRAAVRGEIRCLRDADTACKDITVTLLSLDSNGKQTGQRATTQLEANGRYSFADVLPGLYEVTVPDVYLCWASTAHKLAVKSAEESVPAFVHNGYLVSVISSHATEMKITLSNVAGQPPSGNAHAQDVALVPGLNTICTKAFGTYDVRFIGCHSYDSQELPRTINIADHAPITVNAIKHRTGVRILADVADGGAFKLRAEGKDWAENVALAPEKQRVDGLYAYRYDFDLQPEERVTLQPRSDTMLFQPERAELIGENDCVDTAFTFRATKGLIVDGRIEPKLAGASVTMTFPADAERSPIETTTDRDGRFTFGPLDNSIAYEIHAAKESYVFSAYDRVAQTFGAHKLCEIVATVRDEQGAPLAGVLLSLSGAESYRKNLVTGDDGTINFHSLSPSQYYLRPMMKEYRFEPTSKVIDITDGQTVSVQLAGKRVAYSVMGAVRTLNGDPFGGAVIETVAAELCSQQHPEEATTEPNGQYRIRGLQPGCEYTVRVKQGGDATAAVAGDESTVDRTIPAQRIVAVQQADIVDVNFVAITPITYVDVIARIEASSNEFYKTLRIQLYRQGASDSPIYSQRVEAPLNVKGRVNPGIMVFFPRIPYDGKTYFVELTSSLSEKTYRYTLPVQSFVANRSSVFVEVEFAPEVRSLDGDLNQNSLSALLLIAVLAVAFFKQDLAFDFFNFLWKRFLAAVERALSKNGGGGGGGGWSSKQQNRNDGVIDESEIEKLAQSINATKRKTVRKA